MKSQKQRGLLIARAFHFTRLLCSGEWVTLDMIAERLNIQKKTAARWLDVMEECGFTLETANDTGSRRIFRVVNRGKNDETGGPYPRTWAQDAAVDKG